MYISDGVLQTIEQPDVAGKSIHRAFVSRPLALYSATPGPHWYVAVCIIAAAAQRTVQLQ